MGLVVNSNKSEVMFQCNGERPLADPVLKDNETDLERVMQLTNFGSILLTDCKADAEINQSINMASAFLALIRKRVMINHNFRITTKVAVYRAIPA